MIRINLLPVKHDRRKESLRNQLIIAVLAILVQVIIMFFIAMGIENEISQRRNKNSSAEVQINRITKTIEGHEEILKEIDEYEQRQIAIDELQTARTGPVQVMLEISRILSRDGRPTIADEAYQELIRKNPSRGFDESWDYRRVWLSSFVEQDKRVTITGHGVSHEDVAEFLRRISLSSFFVSSELVSTNLTRPNVSIEGTRLDKAGDVVSFTMVGNVRYR